MAAFLVLSVCGSYYTVLNYNVIHDLLHSIKLS